MEALLVAGMLVVLTGAYLAARGWAAPLVQGPPRRTISLSDGHAEVSLAVESGDPGSPSVERLVRDVAARTFAAMPDLDEVVVRDRNGAVLGRRARSWPAPPAMVSDPVLGRFPAHPFGLAHPHPPLDRDQDLVGQVVQHAADARRPGPPVPPEQGRVRRPLTDSLELPLPVRELLEDAADPVDLVRALLQAAGLPAVVDRDVVRSADRAVVVLGTHVGDPVTSGMLDHAYLRFRESDASRGVVLSPGVIPAGEARRREMLDPALLHSGLDGLQRMADAVALGADPIDFAAAPALTDS